MRWFLVLVISLIYLNFGHLFAQSCVVKENVKNNIVYKPGVNQEKKLLRVVFHFIQDDDGSFNFSKEKTAYNGYKSGYDIANEIVQRINDSDYVDIPLNIPEGNSLGTTYKNIDFVIDGVYFHKSTQDNNIFGANDVIYDKYKVNPDNSIQIFIVSRGNYAFANSTSQSSLKKYTFLPFPFQRYLNWVNGMSLDHYSWIMSGIKRYVGHEVFHLLGLRHTVRYGFGDPYPSSNPKDPDGCVDTPSPWEMLNVYGSDIHPACGWSNGTKKGCSNNWMDYSEQTALSPCQKYKMHHGLSHGLASFKVCTYMDNDVIITDGDLDHPTKSVFGKSVYFAAINEFTLKSKDEAEVYFKENIIMEPGFSIEFGAKFNTVKWHSCK